MKPLLALLALVLLTAAAPPVASGPLRLCPDRGGPCGPADLTQLRLAGEGATLVRTVTVAPEALPLPRPLMVRIVALASAEVRWNGILIGRNGVPGRDRASETPGRFVASFVVPAALVRPGDNLLAVRLSAHHLWLPVRRPVHLIEVGPYETPDLPGLDDYLPALLALGALAAAFVYFAAASFSDRSARLLAIAGGAAMLQLVAEVTRTFVAYTYPWHLVRVSAIALFAAVTAVSIAAYAGQRFAPDWHRRLVMTTALAALASLILLPWYDIKALGAILAGALALGIAAARGLSPMGVAAAFACVALMVWQRTAFLDRAYYLLLATALLVLVVEQVASLRRARAERDRARARAVELGARLARAEREGEAIVQLKDGTRAHRVAENDILSIRAADDYCDVALADGRTLLVTMSLARFLATLPARFVRVHKSHAVNRAHVARIEPRPGGGRMLTLSDGTAVPIGRSYAASVTRDLS